MDLEQALVSQAEKIASDGHVLSEGITDRPHFNIDNYRKINKSLQEIIGLARINLENITKVHKAAVTQIPENPRDPVPDVPRETGKRKAARPVRLIEDHPPSVNHRTAHNASSRVSRARTNPSKDTTRMLPVSGRQNLRLPKTPDFMVQQYVPERMRSRYNELRSNVLGQLQGVPEERRSVTEESMLKIVHELGAPPAIWQLRIACSLARHPIASPPTIDSDTTTAKALASQLDRLSQHTGRWAYLKCLYQYRLHQAFVQLNGNAHPQSQRRSGRQNYPSTQVMMQAAYPDITEERPWEWHLACRRLQEHKFHGRRLAKLVEHYQSEGIIMLLGANRWRYMNLRDNDFALLFRIVDEGRSASWLRAVCHKAARCINLIESPESTAVRFVFEDMQECELLGLELDSPELTRVFDETESQMFVQ